MKKNYIMPSMKIAIVEMEDLIAESMPKNDEYEFQDPNEVGVKGERHFGSNNNAWSNEW